MYRGPCLCGADDCPRCRPDTYGEALTDQIEQEASEELAFRFSRLGADAIADLIGETCGYVPEFDQAMSALVAAANFGDKADVLQFAHEMLEQVKQEYIKQNLMDEIARRVEQDDDVDAQIDYLRDEGRMVA